MSELVATPSKCTTCWTALAETDIVCSACGSAVVPPTARSIAARRGLMFSLLPFAANFVANLIGRLIDPLVLESDTATALFWVAWIAEMLLLAVLFAANAVLIVLAFRFSVKGLKETRDGALAGRGSAKAGVVFAVIASVLYVIGLTSQVVQFGAALFGPVA